MSNLGPLGRESGLKNLSTAYLCRYNLYTAYLCRYNLYTAYLCRYNLSTAFQCRYNMSTAHLCTYNSHSNHFVRGLLGKNDYQIKSRINCSGLFNGWATKMLKLILSFWQWHLKRWNHLMQNNLRTKSKSFFELTILFCTFDLFNIRQQQLIHCISQVRNVSQNKKISVNEQTGLAVLLLSK